MNLFLDKELLVKSATFRKPTSRRSWARDLKKLYGNCCLITGLGSPTVKVEAHHLNCVAHFPELELSLLNGVPLAEQLHKRFHARFGQTTNTESFLLFLEELSELGQPEEKKRLAVVSDWVKFLHQNQDFWLVQDRLRALRTTTTAGV